MYLTNTQVEVAISRVGVYDARWGIWYILLVYRVLYTRSGGLADQSIGRKK
jgi:hypothetical protein